MAAMVFSALFLMMWTFSATAHARDHGQQWIGPVVGVNSTQRPVLVHPADGPTGTVLPGESPSGQGR